jgi:CRP/FNR family cyclic AMP-dependent transcriptional regulator
MRLPTSRTIRGAALLCDLDPDLVDAVPAAERAVARRLRVPTLTVTRGTWLPPASPSGVLLGLLVADGVALRCVTAAGFPTGDLLCAGDLIPTRSAAPRLPGTDRAQVSWQVVDPLTVAVLDSRFAAWTARWPALVRLLFMRQAEHTERLMARASLMHRQRVEERVLLLLWALSDRWGTVTRDGILVPIPLRHHQLAALTASLRPSVTLALQRLDTRGIVERHVRGYLLRCPLEEAWERLGGEREAAMPAR